MSNQKNKKRKALLPLLVSAGLLGGVTGLAVAILAHKNADKGNPYYNIYNYNNDGDLSIEIKVPSKNANQDVIGIFKDKNGNEYEVKGTVDKDGNLNLDTSSLPAPGSYNLDRIVSADDQNAVIVPNDKLTPEQKDTIRRPATEGKTYHDENNNKVIELDVNKGLTDKEVIAKFEDENGNIIEVAAKVDENGKLVINTDTLPNGSKYTLDAVVEKGIEPEKKVVNVSELPEDVKVVNKLDYPHQHTNEKGDIIIDAKVSPEEKGKETIAIFKDEKGQTHEVKGTVEEDGTVKYDTSSLPNPGKYNLDKIVSADDKNNVLIPNEELSKDQKDTVVLPGATGKVIVNDKNEKQLEVTISPSKKGEEVTAVFKDSTGKEFPVKGKVDTDGKVVFDSSSLPEGEIYKLDSLNDNNGKKIANTDSMTDPEKTISKLEYDKAFDHNDEGDLIVKVDTGKENANKEVVAVFKDKEGNEHKVNGTTDENGKVKFDTDSLPNPGEYNLDKVVDKNDESKEIVPNEKLTPEQKSTIKKPEISTNIIEDANGNKTMEIQTNEALAGKTVDVEFENSKGEKIVVPALVDPTGKITIDSSDNDKFPEGEKYTVTDIKDAITKDKLVDVSELPKEDATINKTNAGEKQISEDNKEKLVFDVPEEEKGKELVAEFKDKDGNVQEVKGTVDENGKVSFDLSELDPEKIYDLDKVVDKSTSPEDVVVPNEDLSKEVKTINDTPEQARKVEFSNPRPLNLKLTSASLEFTAKDVNSLSVGKDFELIIVQTSDENKTFKATAKINQELSKIYFDFNALESNVEYKFKSLEFTTQDSTIKVITSALENFKFTTAKYELPKWSSTTSKDQTTNSVTLDFTFKDDNSEVKLADKEIKVKYVELLENGAEGQPQEFKMAAKEVSHVLNSLKGNTKYIITDLLIDVEGKEVALFRTEQTKEASVFATTATEITLSWDVNNKEQFASTLNDAELKVSYVDADKKLKVGNEVTLKFKKKDTTEEKTMTGRVIEGDKIQFNFTNLEKASTYEIIEISMSNVNDGSATEYKFTQLASGSNTFETKDEVKVVSVTSEKTELVDEHSTVVKATIKADEILLSGQKIKIQYKAKGFDNEIIEAEVDYDATKSEYTFNLENLKGNREYVFVNLLHGKKGKVVEEFLKEKTLKHSIKVQPTAMTVNLVSSTISSVTAQEIKFELTDPDGIFEENQQVTIEIASKDNKNSEQISKRAVVATEGDKKVVTFTIDSLPFNKEWKVYEVKFASKPDKATYDVHKKADNTFDNVIYNGEEQGKEILFERILKLNSLTNAEIANNASVLTYDLKYTNELFGEKFIKALYTDNNGVKVWTNAVQIKSNANSLTLESLVPNRKYTLVGLFKGDSADAITENAADKIEMGNVENSIVFTQSETSIEISGTFNSINADSAKVKFEVSSKDQVFETSQQVTFTFAPVAGKDDSNKKEFTVNLTNEGDKWFASLDLTGLTKDTEYKLYEAKFTAKPAKANVNLNNDASNIVYDSTKANAKEYKFKTLFDIDLSTSVLTMTENKTKDETKVGKDLIQISYDYSGSLSNVKTSQELMNDSRANKGFSVKFTGKATAKIRNKTTSAEEDKALVHELDATDLEFNRDTQTLTFKLKGIKPGYDYELTSIKLVQNEHNNTQTDSEKTAELAESIKTAAKFKGTGYGWEVLELLEGEKGVINTEITAQNDRPWIIVLGFNREMYGKEFSQLFNYLITEAPTDIRTKWVDKLKELMQKGMERSKEEITTINLIQFGNKFNKTDADDQVVFANGLTYNKQWNGGESGNPRIQKAWPVSGGVAYGFNPKLTPVNTQEVLKWDNFRFFSKEAAIKGLDLTLNISDEFYEGE